MAADPGGLRREVPQAQPTGTSAGATDFAQCSAAQVREDHARFADAFRDGHIPGVTST
ncbi:hypothetical protein [Pseudonocardia kujensis]|uniref:hypothetical protein n=1 Tax=Pseudonocardia kujensis TaxID=1128675 RepID=UPI001E473B55|nr:hypothetical protein [Pseudonocardia kujensis]